MKARIIVMVDADTAHRSPRQTREHFIDAIRDGLIRAVGRIDTDVLDEYWRALPGRAARRRKRAP